MSEKYSLLQKVGKGGFATVYKAIGLTEEVLATSKRRPYAVKVVEFDAMSGRSETVDKEKEDDKSEQVRLMTITEVDIMGKADHPSIIKLYDVYEAENQMWLVIEFMGGGDLEGHVNKYKGVSEAVGIHVFKQVCEAVDYCHDILGVVHRDLKPENILILEPPTSADDLISVKLADFGLSTEYESTKVMKLFCGTPYFFAPELMKDAGYSRAVDCWSLGVILYWMISSKLPFVSRNKEELTALITSGVFQFPPEQWEGSSESSRDLIKRLLNTNALKRYSVKEAIDHPWMRGERTVDSLAPTVFDMLRVDSMGD